MAKYEYDLLNDTDWKKLKEEINELSIMFSTKEFRKFIADKCLQELEDIQSYSLTYDEHSVFDAKVQEYRENHKVEYGDDYILISNSTNLDNSEMWWVSPPTRQKYPDGISVAYIIEYGTGLKGTSQDDWQVNVNGYGANGWHYTSPDSGFRTTTTGLEGRFIYQKLLDNVSSKMESWVFEYMERNEW